MTSHKDVKNFDGKILSLYATDRVIRTFNENRIFFGRKATRFTRSAVIMMRVGEDLEHYACYSAGNRLFQMGAFSYSESALPFGIKIGRYCSIAKGIEVFKDRHPLEWVTTSSINYDFKPTNGYRSFVAAQKEFNNSEVSRAVPPNKLESAPVIENDVWIGQNVQLARGIKIGNGAVIAAGAVVTKDVQPFTVVGGVPAKHIKFRFNSDVIESLLRIRWWDHDPSIFRHYQLKDPLEFVRGWDQSSYRSRYSPKPFSVQNMLKALNFSEDSGDNNAG